MQRAFAVVVSLVVAAIVVAPAFADPPDDSYPLSNYPMFAEPIEAVGTYRTVVGRTADGERVTLDPGLIAATDEVIQAAGTVINFVTSGRAGELCRDVAARVASSGRDEVTTVEVIAERYEAIAYFDERDAPPLDVTVDASCEVTR